MNGYPQLRYSNNQVKKAGKALRGALDYSPETVEVFRIAYNWRDSHAFPMRKLRHEIMGKIRIVGGRGITAARTKRMASIRKKLRRTSNTLLQMQDLGGCRAIMEAITGVKDLVRVVRIAAFTGWQKSTIT
jgi:ppGpp synthetase/RelA/SpoT-type nucleotidyltranferase